MSNRRLEPRRAMVHDPCVQDRYVAAMHASGSVVRDSTVAAMETVHVCAFDEIALDPGSGRVTWNCSFKLQMLDLSDLEQGLRVLEVGAGSGYASALMQAGIGNSGILETLALNEQQPLVELGPAGFDRIVVWPTVTRIPLTLCNALKPTGRLLCTLDRPDLQIIVEIERSGGTFRINPMRVVSERVPSGTRILAETAVCTAGPGEPQTTRRWSDGPGNRVVDFWGWLINRQVTAFLWPKPAPEAMWLDVREGADWGRLRIAAEKICGTDSGVKRMQEDYAEWSDAGRPRIADVPVPWALTSTPVGDCLTPDWASIDYRREILA